jgi:inosine-uridine nucleoside N-ribohydrolase
MRAVGPPAKINGFVPWDVTALAYFLHPEWFHDNWVRAELDLAGWGCKSVRVFEEGLSENEADFNAPDQIVEEEKFWEWFFGRI